MTKKNLMINYKSSYKNGHPEFEKRVTVFFFSYHGVPGFTKIPVIDLSK